MKPKTIYKSEAGKKKIQDSYESYLKTFDVVFEREYVETRYGKTHTLVTGPKDGKPLFILQGGNSVNPVTLSWFKNLLQDYRVYAPDTIGHPGFSEEVRISAKDNSFANWLSDVMDHFKVEKSAFIGPSYGAGIILRLATYLPERIDCSILVAPAGIKLGSKFDMIRKILLPLMAFNRTGSQASLNKIADVMSAGSMNERNKQIIGEVFKYVKLEQNMPKLTERKELINYKAPTMVIMGEKDIFFPEKQVINKARQIIPNLVSYHSYDMGHFPSEEMLEEINREIKSFLNTHY
ncbi:alpha/beta hydrolase [Virgibacillus sp. C22-A2]|uniref:Alpha/beta hydrolase n=1 Tax=Virgibacillus tibetensis TaxID=3042313 RepID=A0ABU6KC76_9BACI|nr:alpha/beta hydrolase [Virgibacillus sp. C22-A2]